MAIGNGKTEDYLVMPTSLDTSILPLKTENYVFDDESNEEKQYFSIKAAGELKNFMTFGIYGRNYALDTKTPPKSEKEDLKDSGEDVGSRENRAISEEDDNNLSLKMTIYIVLMVFLSIITAIMTYRKLQHPYVKPDLSKRRKSSMPY